MQLADLRIERFQLGGLYRPAQAIDPNGFMVSLSSPEALSQPLGYSLRFTTDYLSTLLPDAGEATGRGARDRPAALVRGPRR